MPIDEYPRSEWDRILAVDLTGLGSSGDKCECRGKRPSPSKKAHKSRDARTKKRKSPGLYEVSKAAARVMRARGSGRIIKIASIAGLVPLRLQCAFVAAKAGVINLTRAMALELGPHGILVNGTAPGSTLTEGTRRLFYGEDGTFREHVQQMLDHVPLSRPGTTDEIAVAALFLADPENSYMNGHIVVVDGGWTAGYRAISDRESPQNPRARVDPLTPVMGPYIMQAGVRGSARRFRRSQVTPEGDSESCPTQRASPSRW